MLILSGLKALLFQHLLIALITRSAVNVCVGELNENIEKLTKLLANMNMAGPCCRMAPVKCLSCGETGHISRYC